MKNLIRKSLLDIIPYSSARNEFTETGNYTFLDANENSYEIIDGLNHYPDPYQTKLKDEIAKLKNISSKNIFLSNGSDETLDFIVRLFCEPAVENIIVTPPTFPMYNFAAKVNNVEIIEADLNEDFSLNKEKVLSSVTNDTKVIFICSPNNPTGNSMNRNDILEICDKVNAIVVVDEAYIEFSTEESLLTSLNDCKNLIVTQTFSKAWSLAGLRLGMTFANEEVVSFLNKIKMPYNISQSTINIAFEALDKKNDVSKNISQILADKENLFSTLNSLSFVRKIFASDANFCMFKCEEADSVYKYLIANNVVVRNVSKYPKCENCLRASIGTTEENNILINLLKNYE